MFAEARSVLYLAWLSARFSAGRLVGITVGIALGTALILLLAGAAQGLSDRDHRAAWLREEGGPSAEVPLAEDGLSAAGDPRPIPLTSDSILVERTDDVFRDRVIQHRTVAATPDSTVKIPGVGTAPEPGTYYASPALQELIESTDHDQLGGRYGTYVGAIADSALAGPDSLVVVSGSSESDLRGSASAAVLVSEFTNQPYGDSATVYRTLISMGAIAVLFPVLLLINISTQWGATVRADRLGALRLIGATPRVISSVAAAEAFATSLAGTLIGVLLASALRPVAASLDAGESRLFLDDLVLSGSVIASIVAVVVVLATILAYVRAHRLHTQTSEVASLVHERRVTARRVIPVVTGLLLMAVSRVLPELLNGAGLQVAAIAQILGFITTAVGVTLVGPWLVQVVSRSYAQRAQSAAAVIAGQRMALSPGSAYRAVSGVVIAVFAVSVFSGAASSVDSPQAHSDVAGVLPSDSVYAFLDGESSLEGVRQEVERANGLEGIESAVIAYGTASWDSLEASSELFVPAVQLRDLGFDGAPQTDLAAVDGNFFSNWNGTPMTPAPAPGQSSSELVPFAVVIGTDGSAAALDRARTYLSALDAAATPPMSRSDNAATWSTRLIATMAVLANLGMFVAVAIAGLTLAVSTAASIVERKRVFGMLRLMGMPMALLRGIVIREAVLPLLTAVFVAAGLGYLVAALMVNGFDDSRSVSWPDASYFLTLGVSAALAVGAVVAACGLLWQHKDVVLTRYE